MVSAYLSLLALQPAVVPPAPSSPPPLIRTVTVPAPPPQVGPGGARARANLASYVTDADYPADAARAGQEGTTGFRLTVGPDGRVTDCTVTQSSGSPSLDATTCRLMRSRARFTPALDAAGKPAGDSVSARIAWRLPKGRPVPDLIVSGFTLRADGTPRNCTIDVTFAGKTARREAADCAPAPPNGALLAAIRREAKGAATRVRIEVRLIRDPAAPWPQLEEPTRRILSRELVRLQIAAGGKVTGCAVLDFQASIPIARVCGIGGQISNASATEASEMRLVSFTALEAATASR